MASGNIPPEFLPSMISGQHGFSDIVVPSVTNIGDLSLTPNYAWGQTQSGSILSGYLSTYTVGSGVISSLTWNDITTVATGRDNPFSFLVICDQCKKNLTSQPRVWTGEVSVSSGAYHCWDCAGYDPNKGGFGWQREEWIRETFGFDKNTPTGVIADYLEERGKTSDGEYLRNRSSR